MAHKKRGKHTGKQKKSAGPATTRAPAGTVSFDTPSSLLHAKRAAEKTLADVHQLMEQQEFSSMEEANKFLEDLVARSGGAIPPQPPRTKVERAQNVMYEAWGTNSGKKRADLARYALEISPDCADAYVLFAEETAKTARERAKLYEQGVRAGERALGDVIFEKGAGSFWGIIETRPYMRARLGLAFMLWGLGERTAAIEHAWELLRLNPGDSQGVRDALLKWLLAEGRDKEAVRLLETFEDEADGAWRYLRALHGFRAHGPSARAEAMLREAIEANPLVPAYLLEERELPDERLPGASKLATEVAALECVDSVYGLWYHTPGALEWMRGVRERVGESHPEPRRPR